MQQFRASEGIFDGFVLHSPETVLCTNEYGTIVSLGKAQNPGHITQLEGMLCPGFVNAHCHTELSHLRGKIDPGKGLVAFIQEIFAQRADDDEVIETAAAAALNEMYQNGIVAVGDVCNTVHSLGPKQHSPLQCINFIEISGFVPATAPQRFQQGLAVWQKWEAAFPGHNQLVPHSPYSVSQPLFHLLAQHHRPSLPSTMHNQESAAENEFFIYATGPFRTLYAHLGIDLSFFSPPQQPSLATVWPWLPKTGHQLLVHNTFYDDGGVKEQAGERRHFLCLCPAANVYIENRLPPLPALLATGHTLVLGTDSLASNCALNIYAEVLLLQAGFSDYPLTQMLQWATYNGAVALGLQDKLGSFAPGKQPGLVLLKENKAQRIL